VRTLWNVSPPRWWAE